MIGWLKLVPGDPDQAGHGVFAWLYRRLGSRYISLLLIPLLREH